jgi:hypothetical protein
MVRALFDFGITEILNPDDLSCTVKYDSAISASITLIEGQMQLTGRAYQVLYEDYKQTYCNVYPCRLQIDCEGQWQTFAIGEIYTIDCEFDLDKCIVSVPFNDLGFTSSINPNKSIEVAVNAIATKNSLPIAQAQSVEIAFSDIVNVFGVIPPAPPYARAYTMRDVFRVLIAYMSDNKIGFVSDYFNSGFGRRYFLTTGKSIRAKVDNVPKVSFAQIFDFFRKKRNLAMGFEVVGTQINLRIEPAAYFDNSNSIITVTQLSNVIRAIDKQRVYSAVDVGTSTFKQATDCDGGNTSCNFTQIPYVGFTDEQFAFCGECNLDNVLDLRTNTILCDTNVIQDQAFFNATDNDEAVIVLDSVIEYNINFPLPGTPFVIQFADPENIGRRQFNPSLTNKASIEAWLPEIPCGVFETLGQFNQSNIPYLGEYVVPSGIPTVQTVLLNNDFPAPLYRSAFDNVGVSQQYDVATDPGNNALVDNGTVYISPTVQLVDVAVQYNMTFLSASGAQIIGSRAALIIQDSTGAEVQRIFGPEVVQFATVAPASQLGATFTDVFLNVGDRLRVDFMVRRVNNIPDVSGLIPVQMVVRATNITNPFATTVNITFKEYFFNGLIDPGSADFSSRLARFGKPINKSQFMSILANPTGIVNWSESNQIRKGRINSATISGLGTKFETNFEIIEI